MADLYDRLEELQGMARLLIDDAKQLRESLSDALDPELEWTRTGPTDGSTPGPSLPLLKQLSSSTSDFFLNWRMRGRLPSRSALARFSPKVRGETKITASKGRIREL